MSGASSNERRFAVLGSPIGHSKSPTLHRAFYEHLGQAHPSFEAIEIDLESFPAFWLGASQAWSGFSVTMPLKSAVARAATHVHGFASEIMVANTVVFDGGASHAHNTDITGLAAIVRTQHPRAASAVVLGSGDTAASALVAVRESGVGSAMLVARNRDAASDVTARVGGIETRVVSLAEWGAAQVSDPDVLISTVPSSAVTDVLQFLPRALSPRLVIDLAYSDAQGSVGALLAERAETVVDGIECLVQQGADQVMLHLDLSAAGDGGADLREELVRVGRAALRTSDGRST